MSIRLDQAVFCTQFRFALIRALASSISFRMSAVRADDARICGEALQRGMLLNGGLHSWTGLPSSPVLRSVKIASF